MIHSWTPEQVVEPELARSLIDRQFPELRGGTIEPFGVGWDNTAYLVNGRLVFRFPRRRIAVELIEVEARVLPRVAPALPLRVPIPRWIGRPDEGYPWLFAGYERLAGRVASDVGLTDDSRERAAAPLGRFLAALHRLDTAGLELPGDTIGRADMEGRMDRLLERIEVLAAHGLVADAARLRRLADESPLRPPPAPPALAHGDLYARHVLVDENGRPLAVIDWGDVHAGHPAVDLGIVHGFLPPAARRAFLDAYGPVDEQTWAFARLRALWYATILMLYGEETGDPALVREGTRSLGYVLAGDQRGSGGRRGR